MKIKIVILSTINLFSLAKAQRKHNEECDKNFLEMYGYDDN